MIFYLATLIQRYRKIKIIFDPLQKQETVKFYRLSDATFYYCITCNTTVYIDLLNLSWIKLEMCQYDTDAPAQGHPHPRAAILQKNEVEKWVITLIIIGRFLINRT